MPTSGTTITASAITVMTVERGWRRRKPAISGSRALWMRSSALTAPSFFPAAVRTWSLRSITPSSSAARSSSRLRGPSSAVDGPLT